MSAVLARRARLVWWWLAYRLMAGVVAVVGLLTRPVIWLVGLLGAGADAAELEWLLARADVALAVALAERLRRAQTQGRPEENPRWRGWW